MQRTRIFLTIAIVVVSAAVLVGCGSASKGDYEKDVKKIGNGVEKDLDSLDSDTPSPGDIEKAQDRIEDAANEIDDIDPPSEVKGTHDDLVDVLHDTSRLMGTIAPLMETATKDPSKLSAGDVEDLEKVSGEFTDIEKRMSKVEKEYKDKDYDVGLGDDTDK